jgi:hypothetical protein
MQPISFPQFIFLQPCFLWYQDDYIMQGIFLENSIDEGHPESKHHLHMALTQVSTPASSMKSRPGPKWFSLAANTEGIFG